MANVDQKKVVQRGQQKRKGSKGQTFPPSKAQRLREGLAMAIVIAVAPCSHAAEIEPFEKRPAMAMLWLWQFLSRVWRNSNCNQASGYGYSDMLSSDGVTAMESDVQSGFSFRLRHVLKWQFRMVTV